MPEVAGPEPAKNQSKDWSVSTEVEVRSKKTRTADVTDGNRPRPDLHYIKSSVMLSATF
jgi:hypothetical protein